MLPIAEFEFVVQKKEKIDFNDFNDITNLNQPNDIQKKNSSSSEEDEQPASNTKTEANHDPDKICPDNFEFIKTIGKGYFGTVSQVKYKKDGQIYALKSLKKSKLKDPKNVEHTLMERKILEKVKHPFIVQLKFAFQTEPKIYIVMDYHNGGELFFHLRKKVRFKIEEARFYFAQLVLAIEFLHSNNIIYRYI